MVIVTLKTILNEKIGYHFCQVIIVLATTNSGSIYEIKNLEVIINILISSREPRNMTNDPTGVATPG